MIGPGIAALLVADSTCSGVVGSLVYPLILPTKAPLPAATYQVISNVPSYSMDGLVYAKARLQIDAWGNTYSAVCNVAAAIRTVLDRYSGTLPNGLIVSTCTIDDGPADLFEPDSLLYRAKTDYVLLYSQPA